MLQHAPHTTTEDPEIDALGWQVEGGMLLLDVHVGALFMPTDLAARVHHVLSVHMLAGPVIAYPDGWALITGPDVRELPDDPVLRPVAAGRPGERVPLPPEHGARWINRPTDPPAWQTVISATRRALAE